MQSHIVRRIAPCAPFAPDSRVDAAAASGFSGRREVSAFDCRPLCRLASSAFLQKRKGAARKVVRTRAAARETSPERPKIPKRDVSGSATTFYTMSTTADTRRSAVERLAIAEQELLDLFDSGKVPPRASIVAAHRREIAQLAKEAKSEVEKEVERGAQPAEVKNVAVETDPTELLVNRKAHLTALLKEKEDMEKKIAASKQKELQTKTQLQMPEVAELPDITEDDIECPIIEPEVSQHVALNTFDAAVQADEARDEEALKKMASNSLGTQIHRVKQVKAEEPVFVFDTVKSESVKSGLAEALGLEESAPPADAGESVQPVAQSKASQPEVMQSESKAAPLEEMEVESKASQLEAMQAELARLQAEKNRLQSIKAAELSRLQAEKDRKAAQMIAIPVAADPMMALTEEVMDAPPSIPVVEQAPVVQPQAEPVIVVQPEEEKDPKILEEMVQSTFDRLIEESQNAWAAEEKVKADEEVGHYQHEIMQAIQSGQTDKDGVYFCAPSQVLPGQELVLYYSTTNTPLNGRDVKMLIGVNCWRKEDGTVGPIFEEMMVTASPQSVPAGGDWKSVAIQVPEDALVVSFVCSDANGEVWDNNDKNDYHIPVARAMETMQVMGEELSNEFYERRWHERVAQEFEACRKQVLRNESKRKTKEAAMAVIRRQQEHVLFTEPAQLVAGQPVTVFYNPQNTCLNHSSEVNITGGFNFWQHDSSFSSIRMTQTSSSHLQATVQVPKDATMMDFVFHDNNGCYDNKGKLDYHLPVIGGVDQSTGQPAEEKPLFIVHITVEMAPIAKVGGLGDVVTSLGRAVQDEGHRVAVILPKYDVIKYHHVHDMRKVFDYQWGGCNNNVYKGVVDDVDVYFLEPENGYFSCGTIYGADWLDIPMMDAERFGFFSKSALEFLLQYSMQEQHQQPDIIHCHDWQTGPTAKAYWDDYHPYGLMSNPRLVFTIHNLNYGVPLVAEAMQYSQFATTVSPTYAMEVSGQEAIAPHLDKFIGVRNGIDPEVWDPRVDPALPVSYDSSNLIEGKRACKRELRARSNLCDSEDKMIVGVVTRLTTQKGIHLIKHALYQALDRGCQVVLLGSAPDPDMQEDWDQTANDMRNQYWNDACLHLYYDEPLSHLIYAGSDILLVPSMFEPCGLSQLIAMAYGTVPVVRRTGGLADTVFDVDHDSAKAEWEGMKPNGFSFDGTDNEAMDYALNRAIDMWYDNRQGFYSLQKNCIQQDWSWNRPALDYLEIYHAAMKQ